MLKALVSVAALTAIGFATPAPAQMMCGPGQQAQSTAGGMMCGPMGAATQAKPGGEDQKSQASGMCPCCRNMTMMRRGGGTRHDMPGMETPKAQ